MTGITIDFKVGISEELASDFQVISTRKRRVTRTSWHLFDEDMLLPSKLVCHRVRLSQPALMSKIVSVHDARFDGENRKRKGRGESQKKGGETEEKRRNN